MGHSRIFLVRPFQVCGRNFTIISSDRYACPSHRSRGTCNNDLVISRSEIEARVLSGLKTKLLTPELIDEFIAAFNAEVARLQQGDEASRRQKREELAQIERSIANVLAAIERGIVTDTTKDRLLELEGLKSRLTAELVETSPRPISIHPSLVKLYQRKVSQLEEALNAECIRSEAADASREIIREIRAVPDRPAQTLKVVLYSDLDTIASLAEASKRRPGGPQGLRNSRW